MKMIVVVAVCALMLAIGMVVAIVILPREIHRSKTGDRPIIVAHRGASHDAPENTLIAYEQALATGVEMAECDVYLSKDGVPICFHDDTLDRTTNGSGKPGDFTVAELKKLDAGTWKNARYAGEQIPTLIELLQLVDGKLRLVIEIKQAGIEQQVVDAIRKANVAPESVMIFSFKYETIKTIAQLEPLLPTTWLIEKPGAGKSERLNNVRRALMARCSAIGVSHKNIDADLVKLANQSGFPVFVWTVNNREKMIELHNIGVDAIITDRPKLALKVFENQAAEHGRMD